MKNNRHDLEKPMGRSKPAITIDRAAERANVGERMASLKKGGDMKSDDAKSKSQIGTSIPAVTMARAAEQSIKQANRRRTDQDELTTEQRQHLFMQGLAKQVGIACDRWLEGRGITYRSLLESPAGANVEAGTGTQADPPGGVKSLAANQTTPSNAPFFHAPGINKKRETQNLTLITPKYYE